MIKSITQLLKNTPKYSFRTSTNFYKKLSIGESSAVLEEKIKAIS